MSIKDIDCRTGANFFFFFFLALLRSADLVRESRAMPGEQVLQAINIKKLKISNKASLLLFVFQRVYFLSKANVKNRSKIRDGMLA